MYKQFLDIYSDEFQIFILNRNLNIYKYFNLKEKEYNSFINMYQKDLIMYLNNMINKENIVYEECYLIISIPLGSEMKQYEEKLNILKRNSIEYSKLNYKQIVELLNMSLFKGINEQ